MWLPLPARQSHLNLTCDGFGCLLGLCGVLGGLCQGWSPAGFGLCFCSLQRKFNISLSLPHCRACDGGPWWVPSSCCKMTELRLCSAQGFCGACQQSPRVNSNRCTPGKLFPNALIKLVSYLLCMSASTSRFLQARYIC